MSREWRWPDQPTPSKASRSCNRSARRECSRARRSGMRSEERSGRRTTQRGPSRVSSTGAIETLPDIDVRSKGSSERRSVDARASRSSRSSDGGVPRTIALVPRAFRSRRSSSRSTVCFALRDLLILRRSRCEVVADVALRGASSIEDTEERPALHPFEVRASRSSPGGVVIDRKSSLARLSFLIREPLCWSCPIDAASLRGPLRRPLLPGAAIP